MADDGSTQRSDHATMDMLCKARKKNKQTVFHERT